MAAWLIRIAWFLAALAPLSALSAAPAHAGDEPERLRIHGSNTIGQALMPALVEDWLRALEYTGIRRVARAPARLEIHAEREGMPLVVEIDRHGAGAGFDALVQGRAELAMLARRPDRREREAGWQLGDLASPDQEFLVALNGARVVVHRDSPLRRIDLAQLRALLAGGAHDGIGSPRVQLGPAAGGLEEFLRERLTGGRPLRPAALRRHRDLRSAALAVADDPAALAVVELGTPLPQGVRALAVSDGGLAVAPDTVGIRSQDYPLVWRYHVYGGQMMSALGRSLALHSITPRAQRVVRAQGLVPMGLAPAAAGADPAALPPAYRDAVDGAARLPLTLRFNLNSLTTIFESSSAQELERVAAWLQQPENRGRAVSVVGFAQADPHNKLFAMTTSSNRADIVAAWLIERGIPVRRTRGLGPLRPLAGGDGEWARLRNERVELWLL
ncbi:flagellar motor protein MotB [Pseudoxanthomonas broegbernensis]|uniref:Flagellar motor protein MotB n=1 Tax=Pseudoxanthomonas broegbernensis TaxID=83619 RepID=A0A7V8GN42_9GAMM|nr:OmpA family protein [Pseudoxanthomonas broegbernensis]KAF1686889.1 flagellar motor protein MotB [Pseudoxanthomonas broegbernensis]MBB6065518.1 phosphate transport system substrate-binding protein [Pseudoxanthomonas broegbernensis]